MLFGVASAKNTSTAAAAVTVPARIRRKRLRVGDAAGPAGRSVFGVSLEGVKSDNPGFLRYGAW